MLTPFFKFIYAKRITKNRVIIIWLFFIIRIDYIRNGEIIYGNYYFDGKYHFIDKCFEHRKEVYAKSVSQFTGLKDIEGKEIYEGDIILGYNNPHVVTFADGAFYLTYKNSSVRLSRTCGALKIIGNIFENPELTQTTS